MTDISRKEEFDILGCKVKINPHEGDASSALAAIDLVKANVDDIKKERPLIRDTDVAVLVALKLANEKLTIEQEYKSSVLHMEKSLKTALHDLDLTQ